MSSYVTEKVVLSEPLTLVGVHELVADVISYIIETRLMPMQPLW